MMKLERWMDAVVAARTARWVTFRVVDDAPPPGLGDLCLSAAVDVAGAVEVGARVRVWVSMVVALGGLRDVRVVEVAPVVEAPVEAVTLH